jgi:hypothetical protein
VWFAGGFLAAEFAAAWSSAGQESRLVPGQVTGKRGKGRGFKSPGGKRKRLLSKALLVQPAQAARSSDRHLTAALDVVGRH